MFSSISKFFGLITYSNSDIINYCKKNHHFTPDKALIKAIQNLSEENPSYELKDLFKRLFEKDLDNKRNFVRLSAESVYKQKYKSEMSNREHYLFDRNFDIRNFYYYHYLDFDFHGNIMTLTTEKSRLNYDTEYNSKIFSGNHVDFNGHTVNKYNSNDNDGDTSSSSDYYSGSSGYSGGGYSSGSSDSYSSGSSD